MGHIELRRLLPQLKNELKLELLVELRRTETRLPDSCRLDDFPFPGGEVCKAALDINKECSDGAPQIPPTVVLKSSYGPQLSSVSAEVCVTPCDSASHHSMLVPVP